MYQISSYFVMALVAGSVAIPARAGVLEIGPSGAIWVAGAPVSQTRAERISGSTDLAVSETLPAPTVPSEWRGKVAELSAKYDLSPTLIDAVVWQESRWNPAAVSPAGARGLAQLMPATASQLGVDSANPRENLEGGARYLRMQLNAFDGDIEKALAAYNAGPGRVQRAGGIPRIAETQSYVAAILGRLSVLARR